MHASGRNESLETLMTPKISTTVPLLSFPSNIDPFSAHHDSGQTLMRLVSLMKSNCAPDLTRLSQDRGFVARERRTKKKRQPPFKNNGTRCFAEEWLQSSIPWFPQN